MQSVSFRILLLLTSLLFLLGGIIPNAGAASDPRFFGSYCGTYRENMSRFDHIDFSIEAHADYYESHLGNGMVVGKGKAVVKSHTLSERSAERHNVRVGTEIAFVFTGIITRHGEADLKGLAGSQETIEGRATLSGNGMELSAPLMGRNIQLSKLHCGNRAPTASITTHGTTFAWGMANHLAGSLDDDEAEPFPKKRLEWTSSKDRTWKKNGYTATINDLSPGTHKIKFKVTDYGGLQATAEKSIHIQNTPPGAVQILRPHNNEEFCSGQKITFDGWATDMESGNLTDLPNALQWTYGAHILIATGTPAIGTLPAGSHTVTLTASDGASSTSTSIHVLVNDPSHGGCSPSVVIYRPVSNSVTGNGSEDCIFLSAKAWDSNNRDISSSIVWKDSTAGAADRTFNGATARACGLHADVGGGDAQHTITAMATDSHGNSSSVSRTVYVIPIAGGPI